MDDGGDDLTRRQRETLALLTEGRSNAGIADALGVSRGTVKNHLYGAYRALGLEERKGESGARVLAALWWSRHNEGRE